MAEQGMLEKLEIIAYRDAELQEEVSDGHFITQVNPEKVSLKYEIEVPEDQAQGTSGMQATFGKLNPRN